MTADCQIPEPAKALLDQLSTHRQLSGLGISIARIVALIDRAGSAVGELTGALMAEPFIAHKLIRAANVALTRRGNVPVTTISKAIILLGLEHVRTLALSTLLISKLGNKRQANRLQGEFAGLIYASTLAREIAGGRSLCDPEEAAVCTLFRFFGRLLVGLYLYESYERVLALSAQEHISENQAAVRLVGLSFDRLGVEILRRWELPKRIVQAAGPCPEVIRATTSGEARLQTVAAFCVEVALGLRVPDVLRRRQSIEALLQRFGPALHLDRNGLKVCLQLADAHAAQLGQALGLTATSLAGEVFEEASTLTFSPLNRPEASLILRAGLATLNRMLSQHESCDAMLKRTCDSIQRAFNFQRVALYSALQHSRVFSLRAVAGKPPHVNAATHCLQGIAKESVVHEALHQHTNLYIRSTDDHALGQSWEDWFALFQDAKSFLLLPFVVEDQLLAVAYADYPRSNVQGWTSEELELVQAIKQLACIALQREANSTREAPTVEE
jgi:eukaryotic-like serine/threonine-protein kinase